MADKGRKGDKSVMAALSRAARAHRFALSEALSEAGIHAGQDALLRCLREEDGRTITNLANALAVRAPTVTKMVNRMAVAGILEKRADETDGRQIHVHFTDAGREAVAVVEQASRKIEKAALKGLTDKDSKALRKALRTVTANLDPTRADESKG